MAPRVFKPSDQLQITCIIINKNWQSIIIKALLYTEFEEVAAGLQMIESGEPNTITLAVTNKY